MTAQPGSTAAAPAAATARGETVQKAMSASGVPIRLLRRPHLGVPDPPYGPAYEKLLPLAKSGDTAAQYQLGLLLYECRDVPEDEADLDKQVEDTYETHRSHGWDVDDPAGEEKALRRRHEECSGVPQAERGRYRDWLKQAADAGLLQAELDLPLHLPDAQYCQYLSECTPEQRAMQEALQKEAVDYLGKARDAGSAGALADLQLLVRRGQCCPEQHRGLCRLQRPGPDLHRRRRGPELQCHSHRPGQPPAPRRLGAGAGAEQGNPVESELLRAHSVRGEE